MDNICKKLNNTFKGKEHELKSFVKDLNKYQNKTIVMVYYGIISNCESWNENYLIKYLNSKKYNYFEDGNKYMFSKLLPEPKIINKKYKCIMENANIIPFGEEVIIDKEIKIDNEFYYHIKNNDVYLNGADLSYILEKV